MRSIYSFSGLSIEGIPEIAPPLTERINSGLFKYLSYSSLKAISLG